VVWLTRQTDQEYGCGLNQFFRSLLGPTHPDVADCLLNYAATLRKVHRKKEAAQLEARARQSLASHNRENATGSLVDWRELQRRTK
jgi:hypothetical protein